MTILSQTRCLWRDRQHLTRPSLFPKLQVETNKSTHLVNLQGKIRQEGLLVQTSLEGTMERKHQEVFHRPHASPSLSRHQPSDHASSPLSLVGLRQVLVGMANLEGPEVLVAMSTLVEPANPEEEESSQVIHQRLRALQGGFS